MAYEPATYGDRIAAVYDAWVVPAVEQSTEPAVAFLAELAGAGPALELGIGTGRIALPLAERGVRVQGIDASEAMVARLREKPGGEALPVAIGDFADVPVEGEFSLIYVVFNTFFALLTQEDQVRCFGSVARTLVPNGAFVIEAFVPDPTLFDRNHPVTQRVTTQHVVIGKEGMMMLPVQLRYAWPSELDLMARLAGLRPSARYGGWRREPFTASSPSHVSVFIREP
jgi:SAM-dependent methyltransferase